MCVGEIRRFIAPWSGLYLLMVKKNILTAGKKRKADEAANRGDRLTAQALYASVCKLDPLDVEAWIKLSLTEKDLGNYPQAERCARRALVLNPQFGYVHYALGQALHSQFQRVDAIASYRVATALMPDFPDAHYLLGLALHEQGEMSAATASLRQALLCRADFPEALAELGAIYLELGLVELGLEQLQRAVHLAPAHLVALGNISHALRLLGQNQAAMDNFRHALDLAPENVDLIAGLAGLLEKAGKTDESQGLVTRALQIDPTHTMTHIVAARLERGGQQLQAAIDRLQGLLQPTLGIDISSEILLEMGQIYDQMGDPASAFPLIVEGKRKKAMATLAGDGGSEAYLARLAKIRLLATPELANVLRKCAEQAAGDAPAPVFLIGFPRSGTTLMEQILDSHPAIQAMEEKSTVAHVVNRALDMLDQQKCALSDLDESQLSELRQLYFTEVAKHISLRPGNVLIDKMPLNTVGVPVIARVFPTAKFIVAIRHPCDVSLSCLMQNFATNASMANFFTLKDTVHLYTQVMGAWLHYAELLPLDFHLIRYEDLIIDVPFESRKLLDFLGLPWDDAVLGHTEHARQRGAINTPSYHQVVQPIYQRSKYRWKRYEQQLSDVMPLLQPFIDKFGYA